MSRIGNVIRRIRRDGLRQTLEGMSLAIRPGVFLIHRLESFPEDLTVSPAAVEAVQTGVEALHQVSSKEHAQPDQFRYDLTRGYRNCLFVAWEREPVAVLWVIQPAEGSRYIELGERDAELGGLFVLWEFRGRGLAKALVWQACRQLRREGVQNIYAMIEASNLSSRRVFQAVGFREVAAVRRPVLFGPRYLPKTGTVESWGKAVARGLGL